MVLEELNIKEYLGKNLPNYMIPPYFVVLDEIMPKSKSLYSIIGFLTGTIIVYYI